MKSVCLFRFAASVTLSFLISFSGSRAFAQANGGDAIEELYQKAVEFSGSGQAAQAVATFDKMLEVAKGKERLYEDFGAAAGGIMFDYGVALLIVQDWERARQAFTDCIDSDKIASDVQTPMRSKNPRGLLAKYQLGYCEAQLGNHEEALKLYDEYMAANPPKEEVEQMRNSFKLRYATSLIHLKRLDEGRKLIQELFDNAEPWDVSPIFLMQGVLELGLGWSEEATAVAGDAAAIDKISESGHEFLDQNESSLHMGPFDQFRFGFVDRLKKLGFESTKVGLYSLALRYFSYLPTIQDIRDDINLNIARLPYGAAVPSQVQALINDLAKREEAEVHPDAETLRLIASCYERLGNFYAPRIIYWNLATQYPKLPTQVRDEVLHEASRLSAVLGDFSGSEYFGEKFMSEAPTDSNLRSNVSSFMLSSLFTSQKYDEVIRVAEEVRKTFEPGAEKRELADALYPLALFATKKYQEAEEPFTEYVKNYPKGENREVVMYHRASDSLVLRKMREAAEQCEDFLKEYPSSERFLDSVLADLSVARFNLGDFPASIAAVDKLVAERPVSPRVARAQNLRGDALLIQASRLPKEEADQAAELTKSAVDAYLAAVIAGKAAQQSDSKNADFYREAVGEALWKSADQYYKAKEDAKGLAQYDDFIAGYTGTFFEPQLTAFSLTRLEAAGRGEEGLGQMEKVIVAVGTRPAEMQDVQLLRECIGTYSEVSVRLRGVEKTLATLNNFPGVEAGDQAMQTWLKIQQVIVLQESRKGIAKDAPEYAAIESKIAAIFEDLRQFEKRDLTEYALQQIGLYFAGTDNPFLGVPYFEELLARTSPAAASYKAPAEMELGKIEMRAADPAKKQSARERFRRIIEDKSEDAQPLKAMAYLNLADLHMQNKEWREALPVLQEINRDKDLFAREKVRRAEAAFKLGVVYDELGDHAAANQAYVSVVGTYSAFHDWLTQAWERYIPNSLAEIQKEPETDPLSIALKRKRKLALYKLSVKYLYSWSGWTDENDSPSGALARLRRRIPELKAELNVTPEEEAKIMNELGISPK